MYFFSFFLVIFIGITHFNYAKEVFSVIDQSGLQILTPSLKEREMEKIILENGLQAYLISDPNTPESAAAIAVNAGCWDDPSDRPGMAHFVEHMLFLGTEKYPDESGYSRFLDEHGGKRNAFTAADRTVFMFSVENSSFDGALDRFSQFFIAPLFNPSGVNRELIAINQEFSKDLLIDSWRTLHVKKELSNEKHPFHSFDIGNAETLKSILREELIDWFTNHYSADRMHLVAISPLPMHELKEKISAYFSSIKKREVDFKVLKEPIFSKATEGQVVVIRPLHEVQSLELCWELPEGFGKEQDCKVEKLVSYVLGHEGEGSLLARLKEKNLALGLSVHQSLTGKGHAFFSINIQLTDLGVKEYLNVIEDSHKALLTLQKYGIPRYIFDEVKTISERAYFFQNREEPFEEVMEYAYLLVDEKLETFPLKSLIPTCFEKKKIVNYLKNLTPQLCRYTLVASLPIQNWSKEQWMGVYYTLCPLEKDLLQKWENLDYDEKISLPPPNRFLPKHLVLEEKNCESLPLLSPTVLAIHKEAGKIYVCQDDRFGVPKICWQLGICTPNICEADSKSMVLADIFCEAVQKRLNTFSYEAQIGGIEYSLTPYHKGLMLKVNGYHENAKRLFEIVLKTIATFIPSENEFLLCSEQLRRSYHNAGNASPLKQGGETLKALLYKNFSDSSEKEFFLNDITYQDIYEFVTTLFKQTYVEGLFFGDHSKTEVETLWSLVETYITKTPFPPHLHYKVELADFSLLQSPSYLIKESSLEGSALLLAIDCGIFNFPNLAALSLLSKGLEEPFFSELRTKQQTGYLLGNWSKEIERHLYTFFAIQSNSHTTRDLLARFELFLETVMINLPLETISEERFKTIRDATLTQLKIPPQTPASMCQTLYQYAFEYEGDFDWLQKSIEAFEALSYKEFCEYANSILGKNNLKRFAIFINGKMSEPGIVYREIPSLQEIRKKITYKPKEIQNLSS